MLVSFVVTLAARIHGVVGALSEAVLALAVVGDDYSGISTIDFGPPDVTGE